MSNRAATADPEEPRVVRARARIDGARIVARLGRFPSAERMLRDARGVLERRQRFAGAARAAATLGTLLVERGELAQAETLMGQARQLLVVAERRAVGRDGGSTSKMADGGQHVLETEREDFERATSLIADPAARPPREAPGPTEPSGAVTADHVACIREAEEAPDAERLDAVCRWLHHRLTARSVTVYGFGEGTARLAAAGDPDRQIEQLVERMARDGPTAPVVQCGRDHRMVIPVGRQPPSGAFAVRWLRAPAADRSLSLVQVAAALCERDLRERSEQTRQIAEQGGRGGLVGESPEMCAVYDQIDHAATAGYPVLIEGETGVGKELVARAVHLGGSRRRQAFCAVNCAALSDELFEAELFGHARGAFTGAVGERIGLIESANRGTLFLDEVGELSDRAQAKLLRVIQEGELRRVGENTTRRVDVQLIAATNRDLAQEVRACRFRQDLLFRLAVVCLEVPPLRARTGDVEILARRLWEQAMRRAGKRATLSPGTLQALCAYRWPGNVRELQNVIARLAAFAPRRGPIDVTALPAGLQRRSIEPPATLADARLRFERRFVKAALRRTAGHPGAAARELGISRQGLAKLLKRLRDDSGQPGGTTTREG